jgi:hypothetical protein
MLQRTFTQPAGTDGRRLEDDNLLKAPGNTRFLVIEGFRASPKAKDYRKSP